MSVPDREETTLGFEEHPQALDTDSQRWRSQQDRHNQHNQRDQQELYEFEKFDDDIEDDAEERRPHQSSILRAGILSQVLKGGVFLLFALAAGWIGGRWANTSVPEEPKPVPQALLSLQSRIVEPEPSVVAPVVAPQEESVTPPVEAAKERAYLGIRGEGVQVGELRNVGLNGSRDFGDPGAVSATANADSATAEAAFAGLAVHLDAPQQKALLVHLQELYEDLSRRSAGVKITEVFPDSPAARAGLRADEGPVPPQLRELGSAGGHIIIGANGHLVRSEDDLARQLALSTAGAPMELLVSAADGTAYEVILVTLGAASDKPAAPRPMQLRSLEEGASSASTGVMGYPAPPVSGISGAVSAPSVLGIGSGTMKVKPDPMQQGK